MSLTLSKDAVALYLRISFVFAPAASHPYEGYKKTLELGEGREGAYFDLPRLGGEKYGMTSPLLSFFTSTVCMYYNDVIIFLPVPARLPYSIRVLLESGVRNCNGFQITKHDVDNLLEWNENQYKNIEIPFRPARVILQDFTSVQSTILHNQILIKCSNLIGQPYSLIHIAFEPHIKPSQASN